MIPKNINKPHSAYKQIKELLLKKNLHPGQKLNYQELSDLLKVSKTPIINALNLLQGEGFVVYESNRGYRIRPVEENEIDDLFRIRLNLECFNVKNAIRNMNTEKENILEQVYIQWAEYTPEFTDRKKLELDLSFHLEIARAGDNAYAIGFLRTVLEHIHFRCRLEAGVERRKDDIKNEHREIFEGIKRRDQDAALDSMESHIKALHGLMMQYLKQMKN